jgi:cobalt-precorrin-5B (C1)-methyltransferase
LVSRGKILRSGYTTGACAAAAAKAAAILLMRGAPQADCPDRHTSAVTEVNIPFPDGSRHEFKVFNTSLITHQSSLIGRASVIKDAGDDPDVTNGAEIAAEVTIKDSDETPVMVDKSKDNNDSDNSSLLVLHSSLIIRGGTGVGKVTKPGLPIAVGDWAINPVPRKMIRQAVQEALLEALKGTNPPLPLFTKGGREGINGSFPVQNSSPVIEITISVPEGEELAKKTLNPRLGIIGGISILGTSGIVRPLSSEAWTASITASMDVARALNLKEVVVSAGRMSEKAHMERYNLPEEAYIMMGDYLEFSLLEAKKHGFIRVHLCAQWAKMLKIAMAMPQTHVRHGALDIERGVGLLNRLGIAIPQDPGFNTAREVFDYVVSVHGGEPSLFRKVCNSAKEYAEGITEGIPVVSHLVSYNGGILVSSE